jgi:hypothetical protein
MNTDRLARKSAAHARSLTLRKPLRLAACERCAEGRRVSKAITRHYRLAQAMTAPAVVPPSPATWLPLRVKRGGGLTA